VIFSLPLPPGPPHPPLALRRSCDLGRSARASVALIVAHSRLDPPCRQDGIPSGMRRNLHRPLPLQVFFYFEPLRTPSAPLAHVSHSSLLIPRILIPTPFCFLIWWFTLSSPLGLCALGPFGTTVVSSLFVCCHAQLPIVYNPGSLLRHPFYPLFSRRITPFLRPPLLMTTFGLPGRPIVGWMES